jgi:hypothetical protein
MVFCWTQFDFIVGTSPTGTILYLTVHLKRQDIKIKILILPIVLYWCENWYFTLREERRLRVFENRVLRRIFGPKREEVTGAWGKFHSEELYMHHVPLAFHSGREADHSPQSSAEVKEWVELYLHSPNTPSWRGTQRSIEELYATRRIK